MAKLLYIEASPRKERSISIQTANTFLSAYRDAHPNDDIEKLDLWNTDLPTFDGDVIDAKYAILHGLDHSSEQKAAWGAVEAVIAQFKAADKYAFSLPMWNFGIPYRLKHYLDVIIQPTYTFSFSPDEGYSGLITGKPAALIYARGGAYPAGTEAVGFDFQKPYMELILGFLGFTDIRPVVVEPTLESPPDELEKIMERTNAQARDVAAGL